MLALFWVSPRLSPQIPNEVLFDLPLLILAFAASVVCLRFGNLAEDHFGKKDAGQIVADEVAGQSMTLLFLPWHSVTDSDGWRWNLAIAATAFIAFRFMDIAKPWPARSLQRIPGGAGILIDDLIAGMYASIATQITVLLLLPRWI